jgi:general secretion pathway protein G
LFAAVGWQGGIGELWHRNCYFYPDKICGFCNLEYLMKKQTKDGFTLLEIMITVGILGLLISAVTYSILRAAANSRTRTAETHLEMIAAATLQLAWDTKRWPNQALRSNPGSTEIWDISTDAAGLADNDGDYDDWQGPYYRGDFVDPWGNPYFFDPDFRVDGVMRVVVGSFGPNGRGRNQYDSDDIIVLLDD